MGNYTIFEGFENPRRGRQARNLTTNVTKILDLKSSSEQIFFKNRRWVLPTFFFGEEYFIGSFKVMTSLKKLFLDVLNSESPACI